MINDYLEIRNAEGMPQLADGSIALEFLLSVKTGVRNCAVALTESATPEVRRVMREQLQAGLDMHAELSELMIKKGWLFPHDLEKQYILDMKSSDMSLQIASFELFPGDTSRLGTFTTPEK